MESIRTKKLPADSESEREDSPLRLATLEPLADMRVLGRGRSGVVHYGRDAKGRELACKLFDSIGVTKLVQCVLLGAPNPYMWNEDAVHCAALRRQILAPLVESWFGSRLRVADALGYGWSEQKRAFELRTFFSAGKPVPLHHPMRTRGIGLLSELTLEVMKPLQQLLIDSGFTGLAWQAGKGNPVALNNFLLEESEDGSHRWVWIDLESGVPALFPLNPLTLFGFYLPRSLRLGRPLFDDVDTQCLRAYVEQNSDSLGSDCSETLRASVALLEESQASWKSLARHQRSIGYRLARGEISELQASWYRNRPLRWYAREASHIAPSILRKVIGLPLLGLKQLTKIPWRRLPRASACFLVSQHYRASLARLFVARRIRAWVERGQITLAESRNLRSHLASEESTSYLTDFGVHIAIKPVVKCIEFWILPALYGMGWISGTVLAVGLLTSGPIARSLYTTGRLLQSIIARREKPWVALGVGMVPVIGNLAYPVQIIYSSTEQEDDLARFILYDGGARIGKHLPVWGGPDTQTEHFFNRLPDVLANLRRSPQAGQLRKQPES